MSIDNEGGWVVPFPDTVYRAQKNLEVKEIPSNFLFRKEVFPEGHCREGTVCLAIYELDIRPSKQIFRYYPVDLRRFVSGDDQPTIFFFDDHIRNLNSLSRDDLGLRGRDSKEIIFSKSGEPYQMRKKYEDPLRKESAELYRYIREHLWNLEIKTSREVSHSAPSASEIDSARADDRGRPDGTYFEQFAISAPKGFGMNTGKNVINNPVSTHLELRSSSLMDKYATFDSEANEKLREFIKSRIMVEESGDVRDAIDRYMEVSAELDIFRGEIEYSIPVFVAPKEWTETEMRKAIDDYCAKNNITKYRLYPSESDSEPFGNVGIYSFKKYLEGRGLSLDEFLDGKDIPFIVGYIKSRREQRIRDRANRERKEAEAAERARVEAEAKARKVKEAKEMVEQARIANEKVRAERERQAELLDPDQQQKLFIGLKKLSAIGKIVEGIESDDENVKIFKSKFPIGYIPNNVKSREDLSVGDLEGYIKNINHIMSFCERKKINEVIPRLWSKIDNLMNSYVGISDRVLNDEDVIELVDGGAITFDDFIQRVESKFISDPWNIDIDSAIEKLAEEVLEEV